MNRTFTVVGGPHDGESFPMRGIAAVFAFIDDKPGTIRATVPYRLDGTAHWSEATIERIVVIDDDTVTCAPYDGPELHR